MKFTFLKLATVLIASLTWGVFQNVDASFSQNTQVLQVKIAAGADQLKATEEVNAIIVDSYTARLDKVLQQLYKNIETASNGNKYLQIIALERVRDDLDIRLDAIAESKLSTNRKKILVGVYMYLKTNIESQIEVIEKK